MSKYSYTDNTLATDPPGGKRHTVAIAAADALPPEQGAVAPKRRRAPARKAATRSAAKPRRKAKH